MRCIRCCGIGVILRAGIRAETAETAGVDWVALAALELRIPSSITRAVLSYATSGDVNCDWNLTKSTYTSSPSLNHNFGRRSSPRRRPFLFTPLIGSSTQPHRTHPLHRNKLLTGWKPSYLEGRMGTNGRELSWTPSLFSLVKLILGSRLIMGGCNPPPQTR